MIAIRYLEQYGIHPIDERCYEELGKHGYLEEEQQLVQEQHFTALQYRSHPSVIDEDVPYIEAHILLDDDDVAIEETFRGDPFDEVINVPPLGDDEPDIAAHVQEELDNMTIEEIEDTISFIKVNIV